MTGAATEQGAVPGDGFRHGAYFYADTDELVHATVGCIRSALAVDEPVMVAFPPATARRLRAELGTDAEGVRFADTESLGRNPARILPTWQAFVAGRAHPGQRVWGIGEPVWPGRDRDEIGECHRHEAVLNAAFTPDDPLVVLCPYDVASLPDDVLDAARRTHPQVWEAGAWRPSGAYLGPPSGIDLFDEPLPEPAGALRETVDITRLSVLRQFVAGHAAASGLGTDRTDELVLAVNELLVNVVRHGGGHGTLRCWVQDGAIVHEVRSPWSTFDAMAGRTTPSLEQPGGRGLWMANQLCDLVQIRRIDGEAVVRVRMHLA